MGNTSTTAIKRVCKACGHAEMGVRKGWRGLCQPCQAHADQREAYSEVATDDDDHEELMFDSDGPEVSES